MPKKAVHRLCHICILVKDIDAAIAHYSKILSAAAPQLLDHKAAKQECVAAGERYLTAFFPAPSEACEIQLLQPLAQGTPLAKRLAEHGEGIHHICFSTTSLEDTFAQLKKQDVALSGERFVADENNPDLRWFWILPKYAHGVLIEVIDNYKLVDGLLKRD
jgi:methylmalonyl-CoA/ethylmalonyl-CoA epimerase